MAVPINSAALGASLIAVAEVLRDPVEKGGDPDKLVAFAARWLGTLLAQARPGTKTKVGRICIVHAWRFR